MRKWQSIIILSVVMLILASCQIDDERQQKNSKAIVYGLAADAVLLDPALVTDSESFKVARNIYETLVKFGEGDAVIEPLLAQKWEISEDGKTYTFQLNEDVYFHDGTELTANAVVKNFSRWMTKSSTNYPYYCTMFGGYKGDAAHIIDYITAPEKFIFVIQLKTPNASLLNNLAMVPFSIASPAAFMNGSILGTKPIGTGPFIYQSWKRNNAITLLKNEDYWKKGLPKVEQLIYKPIADSSSRVEQLLAGDIDIADGLTPEQSTAVKKENTFSIVERPSFNVSYLGMTLTRHPFGDPKIREAISYAINREALIENNFNGIASLAKNPLNPTSFAYDHETVPYEYDVEKAKALLADSTYDGSIIELWAMDLPRPYMPDGVKVAQAIQKDLYEMGLNTKIVTHDWPKYLEKTANGEAQLFLLGGTSNNGDPDHLLSLFFDKTGSLNKTRLDDRRIQSWLQAARETTDEEQRLIHYKQVQSRLREVIPLIPIAHTTPQIGVSDRIKGYQAHPTENDDLSNVSKE